MYKFISHRGKDVNNNYKENSKKALLTSIKKDYISGIEFDIRITKDNNFVIYHNPAIMIKKNIFFIKNLSSYDLKKINLKYDLKLCFLNDLLKKIKIKKIIIIEIKEEQDYSIKQINHLIDLINKYKLNILLVSFNYKLILKIKNIYSNVGLLIGKIINRNKNYSMFDYLLVPIDFYKKNNIDKNLFIWTINSTKDLNKINDNAYIITDKAYKLFNYQNHH